MKNVIFIFLSLVCLLFNVIDAADCISCVNCINNKSPKQGNKYMIYPDHINSCEAQKDSSSFRILAQSGFNGCGYADNINTLYNQCANECSTCKKTDEGCNSPLDRAAATVTCAPSACIPRGGSRAFGRICCDGLQLLGWRCIDPKHDCTPCGHAVEGTKPACDTSGVNTNGVWKCSNPFAGCKSCNFDSKCDNGKRCISGCCI